VSEHNPPFSNIYQDAQQNVLHAQNPLASHARLVVCFMREIVFLVALHKHMLMEACVEIAQQNVRHAHQAPPIVLLAQALIDW
jgi:hypothetical protein